MPVTDAPAKQIAKIQLFAGTDTRIYTASGGIGSIISGSNKYWCVTNANSKKVTEYTINLKYLPANYGENTEDYPVVTASMTPTRTSGAYDIQNPLVTNSTNGQYIPTNLEEATFVLGGNGVNDTQNMVGFQVVSFTVRKI